MKEGLKISDFCKLFLQTCGSREKRPCYLYEFLAELFHFSFFYFYIHIKTPLSGWHQMVKIGWKRFAWNINKRFCNRKFSANHYLCNFVIWCKLEKRNVTKFAAAKFIVAKDSNFDVNLTRKKSWEVFYNTDILNFFF